MTRLTAWLRRWFVWAAPAALVLLNVVWLAGLRGSVIGRGSLLAGQVKQLDADVSAMDARRTQLERTRKELDELQGNLAALRDEQLGPMRRRLIPFLVDVVKRAQDAGLRPERIGYSAQRDEKSGLVHFAAAYSLKGTYEQIRRCVYLLESSPQFVVVEQIGLRGQDDASSVAVNVGMTVGTYFSDVDEQLLKSLHVEETASGG